MRLFSRGEVTVTEQQHEVSQPIDQNRDVMMAAARAYDETKKQIDDLKEQLHRAVAGLEAKNHTLDELKILLAQERNNAQTFRAERDEAVRDHARIVAICANARAILDEEEIQKVRRRRNGKSIVAATGGDVGSNNTPPIEPPVYEMPKPEGV